MRIEKEEITKQLEKERQEKARREAEQLLKQRNLEKEIGKK